MQLKIIAVGKMRAGPGQELCDEYCERFRNFAKPIGFSSLDLLELPESKHTSAKQRKQDEAKRISSSLGTFKTYATMDERGRNLTSVEFSKMLAQWRDYGVGAAAIVIGGPDGLDQSIISGASNTIAFGKATWPHMMVRTMLAEQLYRAATIIGNHPYHRS